MELIHKPEWWCKRSFSRDRRLPDGGIIVQHCAVDAINEVCPQRDRRNRVLQDNVLDALVAEIEVRASLYQRYCFWLYLMIWPWRLNRQKVIWFNDRRNTCHADVMALFQRAIERLEMQALTLVG